jgi:hypothetical protein
VLSDDEDDDVAILKRQNYHCDEPSAKTSHLVPPFSEDLKIASVRVRWRWESNPHVRHRERRFLRPPRRPIAHLHRNLRAIVPNTAMRMRTQNPPTQHSSRLDNPSVAERTYEDWARSKGLNLTQTSGRIPSVCESVLRQFKLSFLNSATRMTLFPNTWAKAPAVCQCFTSERDALAHDWLMVGADLYTAIQKNRIGPRAGHTETESAPAAAAR